MLKRLLAQSVLACAAALFAISPAEAQSTPLSYEPGELLLGFRATAGDGATKCYIVNIGPSTNYTGATTPFTVSGLGNIKADLDANFPGWQNDGAVLWSITGTNSNGTTGSVGGEPVRTMFASRRQEIPGTSNTTRWTRASSSTHAAPVGRMIDMADFYEFVLGPNLPQTPNMSTANSTKARLQNATDNNSYSAFQVGGARSNATTSFAYFNSPTTEHSFAGGTALSILELYRLNPAVGAGIGSPGDFVGTFEFDDNAVLTFTPTPSAQVAFTSATYQGDESGGTIAVELTRSGDLSGSFTVNFSTEDGSAIAGTDYTAQTNVPVSFSTNDTTKVVNVTVADRPGFQNNRSFTVNLSGATNGAKILTPSSATVRILEVETGVQFDAATYTVSETGINAVVKLVRVGAAVAFTATVNTADVDAVAGADYTAQTNAQVEFLAADTEKTISVPVANRAGIQGDRDFTATISNATNGVALGTPAATTVTIEDVVNSGTVVFNPTTYTQAEPTAGTVTVNVTVTRTGGTDGAVSVDVAAANSSTAQSPADYELPGNITLSWAEGDSTAKQLAITIKSDAVAETVAETINLVLQNAQGGVAIGAQSTATVTLPGEDSTAPTLTVTAPKANAKFTAGFVTFTGTATDAVRVAKVEVALNNRTIVNETLNVGVASPFNWTLPVVPEQGLNTAVVTAFDGAGNPSTPVTVTFTFTNLRPLLAGKYNGLLVSTAATDLFLRNGLVTVTVGKTGTFTGSVTIAGTKLPIGGFFLTGDGTTAQARFGKLKTPTFELIKKAKPANIPLGTLALSLSTNGGLEVTGTLKDGGGATLANINADLAVYTAKKNPVAPLKNVPVTLLDPAREKGKYTGALRPATIVAGQPAGNGHGTVTISAAGVVKFVGKAADGAKISYSNALSTDNRWPVFVQLYGKQGFIGGEVQFDSTQTLTDGAGDLTWFKPANLPKQALYPAGWPNGIASDFIASKYLVPAVATPRNPNPPNTATALGPGVTGAPNTTTANIEVELNNGGLAGNTSNDASIDAKSKVTVLGATAGATAANGLKVAFTTKSGAMSGSFTHPGQTKALKFTGVVFQKTGEAYGQFLFLPKTPGVQESGGVFVEEK